MRSKLVDEIDDAFDGLKGQSAESIADIVFEMVEYVIEGNESPCHASPVHEMEDHDLIRELMGRHDNIIIIRERKVTNDAFDGAEIAFHGGVSAAIGLCDRAKDNLLNRDWGKDQQQPTGGNET